MGMLCHPTFFPKGSSAKCCWLHAVLEFAKPRMDRAGDGRPYMLQQKSEPPHKIVVTEYWMANLTDHITANVRPPNIPFTITCWSLSTRSLINVPTNTTDSLKTVIIRVMSNINTDHVYMLMFPFTH